MTKREALLALAARQEQLMREVTAIAKTATLAGSHQLGQATALGMSVSGRLQDIARRPEMANDIEFVEKV